MAGSKLKILIIDENLVRAAILQDGLRDCGDFEVFHIRTMEKLLGRVSEVDPDVILIDLENPSRDTLEQMFQVSRLAKRPIAMFVDRSDSDAVAAAIDAGVSAYVVDGLKRERIKSILDVTISRFNAFTRLQTELTAAKGELEERKIIEKGKSILMRQQGIDEEEAYQRLRKAAMNNNCKIVDIARSLVTAKSLLDNGETS